MPKADALLHRRQDEQLKQAQLQKGATRASGSFGMVHGQLHGVLHTLVIDCTTAFRQTAWLDHDELRRRCWRAPIAAPPALRSRRIDALRQLNSERSPRRAILIADGFVDHNVDAGAPTPPAGVARPRLAPASTGDRHTEHIGRGRSILTFAQTMRLHFPPAPRPATW